MPTEVPIPTDASESPEQIKKIEAFFTDLLELVFGEEWALLQERVERQAPSILTTPEHLCRLGSVLGTASCIQSVPLSLFESVLQVAGTGALTFTDASGRTPFHMELLHLDRPDITKFLCRACPSLVHIRDTESLRGIDILTQKILMKEEHLRYLKDRATAADHQSLADCLECARLVTLYHGQAADTTTVTATMDNDLDLPMMHACCLARSDVPLSLVERTVRRYGAEQAEVQDAKGNTVSQREVFCHFQ